MEGENTNNVPAKKTNGLAIAGFVVSLVSLLCCGYISIVGLILSIVGLNKSKETNSGKGLAIAGIIISAIALVFVIISLLFFSTGASWNIIQNNINSQWQNISTNS